MTDLNPTFVHEGNEVLAFLDGRLIARGSDFGKVEESAVDYLKGLNAEHEKKARDESRNSATHVVTPNGLKGEILSRVEGIWGEKQLTVRFDNGRIAKFDAHGGNDAEYKYIHERTASTAETPIDALKQRLETDYDHDKRSLANRIKDLDSIINDASTHIAKGSSYSDEHTLSRIVTLAESEKLEVKEALDHLESADAEAFAPPAPFDYGVTEQADLGRASSDNWLDHTVQSMIEDVEAQDFDKLLSEGPALFATELETGALADAGVTRDLALAHINSKTAGLVGEEVEKYRDQFIAAVEMARRSELADRKSMAQKEAATKQEEEVSVPDDALFM